MAEATEGEEGNAMARFLREVVLGTAGPPGAPRQVHLSEAGFGERGRTLCGLEGDLHAPGEGDVDIARCAVCAGEGTERLGG